MSYTVLVNIEKNNETEKRTEMLFQTKWEAENATKYLNENYYYSTQDGESNYYYTVEAKHSNFFTKPSKDLVGSKREA